MKTLSLVYLSLLVAALGLSLFHDFPEAAAELVEAVVEDPVLFPHPAEFPSKALALFLEAVVEDSALVSWPASLFLVLVAVLGEVVVLFLEAVVCF